MVTDFVGGGAGSGLSGARKVVRGQPGSGQRDNRRHVRPAVEALEPRALFSAGAIDPSFGAGGQVRTDLGNTVGAGLLVTQGDGKFLTVSYNTSTASSKEANLLRYNRNGTLDTGFGTGGVVEVDPGVYANIDSVVVESDGKILVGLEDQNGAHIVRLSAAGVRDTHFGTAGVVDLGKSIFSAELAVTPDGSIVVAGKKNPDPPGLAYPGGNAPYELAVLRYGRDGSPDQTFGVHGEKDMMLNGIAFPSAVAVQRDGRIVVAGALGHGNIGHQPGIGFIARFDRHGDLDTGHGAGGIFYSDDVAPASVALTQGGRIVIGGGTSAAGQVGAQRLTASLKLDKSFGTAGKAIVDLHATYSYSGQMVVQLDGKILLTATINDGTAPTTTALVRLHSNGRPDHAFGKAGVVEKLLPGNGTVTGIGINGNRILLPATVQPDSALRGFEIAVFAYKQH